MICAISPVYNESAELVTAAISHLLQFKAITQIIIAASANDPRLGEIKTATQQCCDRGNIKLVVCDAAGRARQMNHAAQSATAEHLLFIHGDTRLPHKADELICAALAQSAWGRFDVQLDDRRWVFSIISWFMNTRSRITAISTGDQAIFVRRELFDQLGGFPDQALMEDIEFCKRAKKCSPPAFIDQRVKTSARRWQQGGIVKTVVLMWWLRALYWSGTSPDYLARFYRTIR